MFASIGVGVYMLLWSVLVFILLFFFTPFGGGWVIDFEPAPYRREIRSLKVEEAVPADAKPAAEADKETKGE